LSVIKFWHLKIIVNKIYLLLTIQKLLYVKRNIRWEWTWTEFAINLCITVKVVIPKNIFNSSFKMFRHILTKLKELSPFLILDCRKHNRLFPFMSNFILRPELFPLQAGIRFYMDNARCFNYVWIFWLW
jgi:hypothetical protein